MHDAIPTMAPRVPLHTNTGRDKDSIEPLPRNLDRALLERSQRFEEARTVKDAER
jgi:hypothetical protein